MPLTTSSNGDGINKVNLGVIDGLPDRLKNADTFAVYNQVRTVNTDRFENIFDTNKIIYSVELDDQKFGKMFKLYINDITKNIDMECKYELYKNIFEDEVVKKVVDLAYTIKKLENDVSNNGIIENIKLEIYKALKDVKYDLKQVDIDNGIKDILEKIIKCS